MTRKVRWNTKHKYSDITRIVNEIIIFLGKFCPVQVLASFEAITIWQAALQWISSELSLEKDTLDEQEEKLCAFLRSSSGDAWPKALALFSELQHQRLAPTTWMYNELLGARMSEADSLNLEAPDLAPY